MDPVIERWSHRLSEFVPEFFAATAALTPLGDYCAVLLHGSTTRGVDDACSDLDLWVLAEIDLVQRAEATAGTRFFSFKLDGKEGHFNLETINEATDRVHRCDLERIAELRRARVLRDWRGVGTALVSEARRPMSDAVRSAWLQHHYVEMRGFHRNCDNPIDRGDALAVLQGLSATLSHALRAAMVLDREPYPYIKWLGKSAAETPTGRALMPLVDDVFQLLAADALQTPGPEAVHPLSLKLRQIRQVLIDRARATGFNEPWLDRWWDHLTQAAAGIRSTSW